MTARITVFAGPTLRPEDRLERDIEFRPPVRHGDLWRLRPTAGDVIVVVDGVYQQYAPLRHQEIMWALATGASVVGAASFGALRAAELANQGMIGIGRVAAAYRAGVLVSDAEVAVLHFDDEDARALTVPLVSIRFACHDLVASGGLDPDDGNQALAAARRLHFTERSQDALRAAAPGSIGAVLDHLAGGGDVKRADALHAIAWAREHAGRRTEDKSRAAFRCSSYTAEESFLTAPIDEHGVTGRHVLAAVQLFDDDFPQRHRDYVERICVQTISAGSDGTARAVLGLAGFDAEDVRSCRYAEPTPATASWAPELRVLVRTFRLRPGRLTYVGIDPEVCGRHRLEDLALWCRRTLTRSPRHRDEVMAELRRLWRVEAADKLYLYALERGFRDTEEAVWWRAQFDIRAAEWEPM